MLDNPSRIKEHRELMMLYNKIIVVNYYSTDYLKDFEYCIPEHSCDYQRYFGNSPFHFIIL